MALGRGWAGVGMSGFSVVAPSVGAPSRKSCVSPPSLTQSSVNTSSSGIEGGVSSSTPWRVRLDGDGVGVGDRARVPQMTSALVATTSCDPASAGSGLHNRFTATGDGNCDLGCASPATTRWGRCAPLGGLADKRSLDSPTYAGWVVRGIRWGREWQQRLAGGGGSQGYPHSLSPIRP